MTLVSFVGRRRELAGVRELLRLHRLVTLTGPGGIGKTRLAVEAAKDLSGINMHSCRFVDLTTSTNEPTLIDAIALVLSVRETRHRALREGLVARLAAEPVLLVLDNCEHVLDACTAAAGSLLESCSRLKLLTTSREPLGLPGEAVYPVPPFPVPEPGEENNLAALATGDAVRLFIERTGPRFTLGTETAPAVAEICRRLDGVPLAIELAAARVGFLTAQEIASRLDDCFHLLTAGPRAAPARHRTLAATLEWSHGLLSAAECLVFRRLSVFSGGFDLEAAEAVCPGGGVESSDVLHLLGRLVAQSLVACQEQETATRYRLLETVRQFATDRLAAAGEAAQVRAAHTAWSVALVDRAERHLVGPQQTAWLRRLEIEHANLMIAVESSLEAGQPEQALRVAGGLVVFWAVRGRLREGLGVLERCLAASSGAAPERRLTALWGAGFLASQLGDFPRAAGIGGECLDVARSSGNASVEARALTLQGFVSLFVNPPQARPLLEESLEPARRSGDHWCEAYALGNMGFAEIFRGDFGAAAPCFERCLAVSSPSGNQQGLRMALIGTGYVALQRGEYRHARDVLEEGLSIARQLGDPFWTAVALSYLCELDRLQGDYAAARRHGEEAVKVARETGSPLLLGFCLTFDGRAAFAGLALPEARTRLDEALTLPLAGGNLGNAAIASITLAEIAMVHGDPGRAATLLEEGLTLARQSGDRLVEATSLLADARFVRRFGNLGDAVPRAHAALELSAALGHLPAMASALDLLAGLAAAEGHLEHAARLFGAAGGIRDRAGFICPPGEEAARREDLARLTAAMSPSVLRTALRQGAGLGTEEACAYAQRGRGPRRRPPTGWSSLTPSELEVVRLAIDGLTNAEIAARLYVSPRTVQTHLAHVFVKLGVHSRRELARQRTGVSTTSHTDRPAPL